VGGDGTTSEVVSGVLGAGLGERTCIGLVPCGTGGDLPRTLGIPADHDEAIARLVAGKTRRLDAGRVRFRDRAGREATAYFLNITSIGLSGLVTELVNSAPKALGGRVSFLIGTLRGIARWKSPMVRVRVDGELVHDGRLVLATAANGRYFGGGMQVAPRALPDDGLLDVVVVPHQPAWKLIADLRHLYGGAHVGRGSVRGVRGRRIEAEAPTDTVWLEIDGEPLGTLPATIDVLPGAVLFLG
jgi:YegS/Rv2252/BmrU family lipid kinase